MKRQYFVPFKIGSLCREAECPPTLTTLTTPPTTQCPGNNDNRNVTEESILQNKFRFHLLFCLTQARQRAAVGEFAQRHDGRQPEQLH